MLIFHGNAPAEGITGINPTFIDVLWKVWNTDEPGNVFNTKLPKSVQSLLVEAGTSKISVRPDKRYNRCEI